MKISARGHYAVRAMLDIAGQPPNIPVTLSNISVRQGISLNFLEQLFVRLRRGNLVKSVRGPGGGYMLAKTPSDITVGSILRTVGEDFSISDCVDTGNPDAKGCNKSDNCIASLLWHKLSRHITEILDSLSIDDLCKESEQKNVNKTVDRRFTFLTY